MQKFEYTIVERFDRMKLSREVERMINDEGWDLCGGVSIAIDPSSPLETTTYCQALYRWTGHPEPVVERVGFVSSLPE